MVYALLRLGQARDQFAMQRVLPSEILSTGHFKAGKFKCWRYGTSDQSPTFWIWQLGPEPGSDGNHGLEIATGPQSTSLVEAIWMDHLDVKGITGMPKPQFLSV